MATNNAAAPADEPGQPPALTTAALAQQAPGAVVEQKITPFEVSGGTDASGKLLPVDYEKLTRDFGATRITPELLERFERVTGRKPHRFMRRGIVLSHRELDVILDRYEKGEPFFLYTGRGPSSDSMHKYMHSEKITIEDSRRYARENAKDIIAIGFDPAKTFIFTDTEYLSSSRAFYENVISMAKRITINQIKGTFGFNDENNIGEFFFCAIQSAPAFATSFPHIFGDNHNKVRNIPCLIPCAIDQDPYFRQTRDKAQKLKYRKPSLLHSVFLPALQGPGSKMSASVDSSAIFLTDTPNQIKSKINKHAFSGGQDTLEKHRELGGRAKDDVPFQYLTFFMEDDDELERLRAGYEAGEILTGEMKQTCIKYLQQYVAEFQERRKRTTEEVRQEFMTPRKLEYKGNPNPIKAVDGLDSTKAESLKKKDSKDKENSHKSQQQQQQSPQAPAQSASTAAPTESQSPLTPNVDSATHVGNSSKSPDSHAKKMSLGGKTKISVSEETEDGTDANGSPTSRLKRLSVSQA
ncbi:Tryptophan--tRNA ligase, cytoplasmic [Cyphellophora attinorum]|uniref:Tryptophan--tRNA ligase, cytoplasmic n=1 Tax=Cyphellophora attinorum TaxID=1664694 RepID=A0A0N0NIH1_9EURO|nr:Tryptophan--tRNA ligase, cytoplasmic [Phialophora attinorum]KPI35738.1 Tryptophan--tRNA ligase, cytoplasmic [Phialophora attinorum]